MNYCIALLVALVSAGLLEQTYGLQIFVHDLEGKKNTVQVKPDDTVNILYTKIASVTGVPSHQQTLIYNGKLMKDEQTLRQSNINENSVVHLVRKVPPKEGEPIRISVFTLSGQRITIQTNTEYTVQVLKEQIASVVGAPSNKLRLVSQGKNLGNDDTLASCGVENGSTVHVL